MCVSLCVCASEWGIKCLNVRPTTRQAIELTSQRALQSPLLSTSGNTKHKTTSQYAHASGQLLYVHLMIQSLCCVFGGFYWTDNTGENCILCEQSNHLLHKMLDFIRSKVSWLVIGWRSDSLLTCLQQNKLILNINHIKIIWVEFISRVYIPLSHDWCICHQTNAKGMIEKHPPPPATKRLQSHRAVFTPHYSCPTLGFFGSFSVLCKTISCCVTI